MELVLATEAQKSVRDRITYEAWGSPLTVDGYLRREQRLRGHPWSRAVMRTWLWTAEGEVLASCETFRQTGTWWSAAGPQRVPCEAVASVFTERKLRGRHYASAMMMALAERQSKQLPRSTSALYSDVGEALYARAGYHPRRPSDWVLELNGDAGADRRAEPIPEHQLAHGLAQVPVPQNGYVVWPTVEQVDWHLERERILSEELGRPRPRAIGAHAGRSTWLWMANFRAGELYVLIGNTASGEDARALAGAARECCREVGLARVRLWDTPEHDAQALQAAAGQRSVRDGSIPMLHPLASSVDPAAWNSVPRVLWV